MSDGAVHRPDGVPARRARLATDLATHVATHEATSLATHLATSLFRDAPFSAAYASAGCWLNAASASGRVTHTLNSRISFMMTSGSSIRLSTLQKNHLAPRS